MLARVANVSAIVLAGTKANADFFHACPRSFTFLWTPMIGSGFPDHRDADEVRSATVAVDADHPRHLGQSATTGSH